MPTVNSQATALITDDLCPSHYCESKIDSMQSVFGAWQKMSIYSDHSINSNSLERFGLAGAEIINSTFTDVAIIEILESLSAAHRLYLLGLDKHVWPLRHTLLLNGVLSDAIVVHGFEHVKTAFCGFCHHRWDFEVNTSMANNSGTQIGNTSCSAQDSVCDNCSFTVEIGDHFSSFYGAYLALPKIQ